jgi:cell division initiation protein
VFLTPTDIQQFALKRRMRGYSQEAVEQLLVEAVASYQEVWRERDELRSEVAALAKELAPLRESEQDLRNALVTAEHSAAEVRAGAEEQAKELLEEARQKAREQHAGAKKERSRLKAEIRRLELVERELHASLRAFLLAGLELVEDREVPAEAPVLEVPVSAHETRPAST